MAEKSRSKLPGCICKKRGRYYWKVKPLVKHFGTLPAEEFGPLKLKEVPKIMLGVKVRVGGGGFALRNSAYHATCQLGTRVVLQSFFWIIREYITGLCVPTAVLIPQVSLDSGIGRLVDQIGQFIRVSL